jgi:hypothetical protein
MLQASGRWALLAAIGVVLSACVRQAPPPVEGAGAGRDVSRFVLAAVNGVRDGNAEGARVYRDAREELRVNPARWRSGR